VPSRVMFGAPPNALSGNSSWRISRTMAGGRLAISSIIPRVLTGGYFDLATPYYGGW